MNHLEGGWNRSDITGAYQVVKHSDLYPAAHFRCALFTTGLILMAIYFFPLEWADPIWFIYTQVPALALGYILAYNKRIKRFFTTKAEMKEEVFQMALEKAMESGWPVEKKSFFLFFSLLEKRIEIILSPSLKEEWAIKDVKKIMNSARKKVKKEDFHYALDDMLKDLANLSPIKSEYQESLPQTQESELPLNSTESEDDKKDPQAADQKDEE